MLERIWQRRVMLVPALLPIYAGCASCMIGLPVDTIVGSQLVSLEEGCIASIECMTMSFVV
jgi:hypothetical protein